MEWHYFVRMMRLCSLSLLLPAPIINTLQGICSKIAPFIKGSLMMAIDMATDKGDDITLIIGEASRGKVLASAVG
jgi:hypothetical protein